MFARIVTRVGQPVYVRYLLASIGALGVDLGIFLLLLRLGASGAVAAAISYSAGIAAHWMLSSRAVFLGRVEQGTARTRQKLMFALSALVGLAVTTGIVAGGARMGFDPRLMKLVAIAASFQITYMIRATVVFTR